MIRFAFRQVRWFSSVVLFNIIMGWWTLDQAAAALGKFFTFIYTFVGTNISLVVEYVTTS